MSDKIISTLRSIADEGTCFVEDEKFMHDAADEITRLRARVAELADKGALAALRDANDRAERAEAENRSNLELVVQVETLRARVKALEAALARDWQPIETAPKDGTEIMLWRGDWPCPIFAFWNTKLVPSDPFWHACEDLLSDIMGEIEDPTHWCEFTPPPSSRPA